MSTAIASTSFGKVIDPGLRDGAASVGALAGPSPVTVRHFHELRQSLERTRHVIWKFSELDAHIRAMEETIFALDTEMLGAQVFLSGLTPELIALQQIAYCRWETELERRFADSVGSPGTIDTYPLVQRFRRLIDREVDLLGKQPVKRLLFIGSGPVPVSAILFHQRLGAQVDCVDLDPMAVEHSRKFLARLRLSDPIRVHCADGSLMDALDYDAVVIALLAKPKHEILAQLATNARPDCRVICRTSQGLRVLVYEPMDMDKDLRDFGIADRRHASHGDTISSLRLARAGHV